jgi:hypothetical protein
MGRPCAPSVGPIRAPRRVHSTPQTGTSVPVSGRPRSPGHQNWLVTMASHQPALASFLAGLRAGRVLGGTGTARTRRRATGWPGNTTADPRMGTASCPCPPRSKPFVVLLSSSNIASQQGSARARNRGNGHGASWIIGDAMRVFPVEITPESAGVSGRREQIQCSPPPPPLAHGRRIYVDSRGDAWLMVIGLHPPHHHRHRPYRISGGRVRERPEGSHCGTPGLSRRSPFADSLVVGLHIPKPRASVLTPTSEN